jgi:hypothetical protein
MPKTQSFTAVHACGVSSVTGNALAAVPTTKAPFATYAPDGAPPPWPLQMGRASERPSIGGRPTRPRRFRAAAPMASAADRRRRTARAGSALSAAVNVTYTAADGGLVAWLNDQTARYNSSTVHVTLPSGTVARGAASLEPPYGLNLILQGQAMAGASNTTLDLERNNLGVGGMLGDGGRIEFRNMRVRNVRPSRACAAVRVLVMTLSLVCAGLCGAPAPADAGRCARRLCCVVTTLVVCAACFMHRDHARAARGCGALHRHRGLLRGCAFARRVLCVALIVASLLQPNAPSTSVHTSAVVGLGVMLHIACVPFCTGAVRASLTHRRKPSCRVAYVAWVRVVFWRFASSPSVPSRAVLVRVACSLRSALHVASPHVSCCMLHRRTLLVLRCILHP